MATTQRHTIEIFSAGCTACREGIRTVEEFAGKEHEVKIHDMQKDSAAQRRAKELGIHRVPAVVVNGRVAQCCQTKPVDLAVIRNMIGTK